MSTTTTLGGTATTVEPYDFNRPASLAREHARALEVAFETFARQWATHVTDKTHVRMSVTVESVQLRSYGDYNDSLPATTTITVCGVPGRDESAIVQFPVSTALGWIVQMVGGKQADADAVDRTALTPIEQALMTHIMSGAIDNLSASLGHLYPTGMKMTSLQYSPQFAQLAGPTDLVIVADLKMRYGDTSVPATVMLPGSVVMEQLSSAAPIFDPADEPANIAYQVGETPMEVAVRLSPLTVKSDAVLGLAVGDIISMPHSATQPFDVVAGDTALGSGTLGAVGARCACVLVDVDTETSTAATDRDNSEENA